MQKSKNLISEVEVNLLCQFCVIMDVKCSFSSLVGGSYLTPETGADQLRLFHFGTAKETSRVICLPCQ